MDNKSIANIFLRIADILEIQGANVFRIRAYRNAAHSIMELSRSLESVYKEEPANLDNIPGIGKDLKSKIIELIETGDLEYYNDLISDIPEGFLDMLDLAGLGPKKLKKLKDELGIENVDALEKACKKGKLEELEGMGKKTQDKLLEAIEYFRGKEGRMLLPEADRCAEEIIGYLSESSNFKKLEKAGSLRRGKETIGDLDILAVAKNSEKAMDYFAAYPGTANIIAKGPTKTSISIKGGPQVDLRIVDKECFGAALMYFTGSKEHNVQLRKIAKRMGYKVSEYGIFSVSKTGKEKMVAGKTEKEVYEKLGLDWMPPEMREAFGEIEAAGKHLLPKNIIKLKDIKGDLHLHTNETDGRASLEEVIEEAKRRKYEYIAITDHSKLVRIANGMDEKRLLKHCDKIRKVSSKVKGIKVLLGVEVDILKGGELDLKDSALKELDIVIAAVHSNFGLEKSVQTERIMRAMDNKYVNVLAHPSGRLITTRKGLDLDFEKIFKKAVENDIILEVNTHGERIDLNDMHLKRAKELGARFVINTDAHDISHMDLLKYGVITARRAAVERKDVINTYGLGKLMRVLGKGA